MTIKEIEEIDMYDFVGIDSVWYSNNLEKRIEYFKSIGMYVEELKTNIPI